MAEEEDDAFARRAELHEDGGVKYGELKEAASTDQSDALERAKRAGHIHESKEDERMGLGSSAAQKRKSHEQLLQSFESRRKARTVVVPTDDAEVRQRLRSFGEPVTFFGEGKPERRERLRQILTERGAAEKHTDASGTAVLSEAPSKPELFFTEGDECLADVRKQIARDSLQRAAKRLGDQHSLYKQRGEEEDQEVLAAEIKSVRQLENLRSEVIDDRPASAVAATSQGAYTIAGTWSGTVKVHDVPNLAHIASARASSERITGVAWHPRADETVPQQQGDEIAGQDGPVAFAAGSADGNARLFSFGGVKKSTLSGHGDRLGRVAFHPLGSFLATTSFDRTWRFWDIEREKELLAQEGHSKEVYSIAFHPDGSLACSVGLDGHGWLWDMRTGRSVWTLKGHHKEVLSVDFAPNGREVSTGSGDNTVRVWDLRKKQALYVIPAHTSLISDLSYEKRHGSVLATASYDRTTRLWDARTLRLIHALHGHENKVMSVDVLPEGSHVVSSSYDRTVKLWSPPPVPMNQG